MSAEERRRRNIGWFFAETVARVPDRLAIIDHWGGRIRQFTYREIDAAMERAGAAFAAAGLRPGERIALLVANRSEFVTLFFGAIRAGLIPVPVNYKLGAATIGYIVADAGCAAAILDTDALAGLVPVIDEAKVPARLALGPVPQGWSSIEDLLGTAPDRLDPPALAEDAQCFQPYTAGSTGRPKGVIATHDGQLWSVRLSQRYWPVGEDERGIVAAPLYHKNAMRGTIKPMLYAGASVVLMPGFEPRAYLEALAEHRCTQAFGVPAMFAMLLREEDLLRTRDFSCVTLISMGSAAVPEGLMEKVERAFPSAAVKESYGLTEGGGPLRAPLDGRPVPRGSCGVPAPETELKLVDGELWIRSPYVCKGYYNLPEVTREKVVDGWLRTGDLFSVDPDGFYYFRGRVDDMFSCGGENIYPKDVENVLMSHADVVDAAVVPHAHRVKGLAPVAMVVTRPGARVDAETLKRFCIENGPAFAHPRLVLLADKLPLSGADKVDRKAIGRMFDERFGAIGD